MVTANVITADAVLGMLRRLPPRERLSVIAKALPETRTGSSRQLKP